MWTFKYIQILVTVAVLFISCSDLDSLVDTSENTGMVFRFPVERDTTATSSLKYYATYEESNHFSKHTTKVSTNDTLEYLWDYYSDPDTFTINLIVWDSNYVYFDSSISFNSSEGEKVGNDYYFYSDAIQIP